MKELLNSSLRKLWSCKQWFGSTIKKKYRMLLYKLSMVCFRCLNLETIPVTNAFCNCPLNPVLQGRMFFTARVRHAKHKTVTTNAKKTATDIPTIYFHLSPECPPASSFVFSGRGTAWWGLEGAEEGKGSFFSFGTAGNEPLLLVLGRAIMGSAAEAPLAEAATRLLDCSASLRRSMSSRFWICDLEEPAVLESYFSKLKRVKFSSMLFIY